MPKPWRLTRQAERSLVEIARWTLENGQRLGGIEIEGPRQELVRVDGLDVVVLQRLRGEIGEIVCHDMLGAASKGGREHMPVVRVRKFERCDKRLVAGDERVGKMDLHRPLLRADAVFELGLQGQQVAGPLVEDLARPSRPEEAGMREAQENVPLPEQKQDVRIEDDDETVGDVSQEASKSCPSRASSSSAAVRAASLRSL